MVMGRPTKLNKEVQDEIVSALAAGNYIETAASYAGIDQTTLQRWLKRGRRELQRVAQNPHHRVRKEEAPFVDFCTSVEKALAKAEVDALAIINAAAHKGSWQAVAWRLERKNPGRWGKRTQVTGPDSGPIRHEHQHQGSREEQFANLFRQIEEYRSSEAAEAAQTGRAGNGTR